MHSNLASTLILELHQHHSECERDHARPPVLEAPKRRVVRIRWLLTSPDSLPTGHDVAVCMSIVENAQFSVVRIGGDGQGPYFECEPSHQVAGFWECGSEWSQSPPDDDAWR